MATNYHHYYQSQLEDGQRYQDFVAERLYHQGIVLVCFQSREYQYRVGENTLGLEIKFDKLFSKTGNFWIETSEKTSPEQSQWTPSGIHRDDTSWLYGIGDYREFWVFAIRTLREYEARNGPAITENTYKTSRGFLLPRDKGSPLSARQFDWDLDPPLQLLRHDGRVPGQEG